MKPFCKESWCRVKLGKHYHLHDGVVNASEVKIGLSGCCLADVHMETSEHTCNLACKKCGNGLKGGGVIVFSTEKLST